MGNAGVTRSCQPGHRVSPSLLVTGQQPALPGQLVVERSNIDNASSFGRELSSAMANQPFVKNP